MHLYTAKPHLLSNSLMCGINWLPDVRKLCIPSNSLGISNSVSSAWARWKGLKYFRTVLYCLVSTGRLPTGLAILFNSASTSLILTASLLEETNLFYNSAPSCLSSGINGQPANLPDVFSISAPTVCTTTIDNPHTAKPVVLANSVHAAWDPCTLYCRAC
jgi:hypothetical protein